MATITKTIKPAGGGDYTSIAAAISGISYTVGDTINLVCFAGDCGMSPEVDALDANVTIVADPSAKHNGLSSQSSAIIATSGPVAWTDPHSYTYTIDGIRILSDTSAGLTLDLEHTTDDSVNFIVQNCLFTGDTKGQPLAALFGGGGTTSFTLSNNVFLATDVSASNSYLVQFLAFSFTGLPTITNVKCIGNSVNTPIASNFAVGIDFETNDSFGGVPTLNITIQDNFVGGCNTDYQILMFSGGIINLVAGGHNASTDSTATVAGITGALTNLLASNQFTDILSDLHLKAGSSLIHTGIAVAGLTTDNQGTFRPNPPSIGAFEFFNGRSSRRRSCDSDITERE